MFGGRAANDIIVVDDGASEERVERQGSQHTSKRKRRPILIPILMPISSIHSRPPRMSSMPFNVLSSQDVPRRNESMKMSTVYSTKRSRGSLMRKARTSKTAQRRSLGMESVDRHRLPIRGSHFQLIPLQWKDSIV